MSKKFLIYSIQFTYIAGSDWEILYYENFDLDNIVMPVNAHILNLLLIEANYNSEKREFLFEGFKNGFPLGYVNTTKVKITSKNLNFTIGDEINLWNKVMKEVKLARYAGPSKEIPFDDDFIQSPIGLVPKDNGTDMHLIFDLSYPRVKRREHSTSVNANTPDHLCKVKHPDFSDAILHCLQEGKHCKIAKSDNRSAFHNLGILKSQWRYLIMAAKNPLDDQWYYFVDKCLPFGASISCSHFQAVSDAVAFLVEFHTGKLVINYLDDYLFVHFRKSLCNDQVSIFIEVCSKINLPVADDKMEWASEIMIFLGFLIDAANQIVGVPIEKVSKGLNMIKSLLSLTSKPKKWRKLTVLQLQQLCGFLNFLGRAVVPGRAFTRRLYAKILANFKPHYHIRLDDEMILDLGLWKHFLLNPTIFSRPFMDFSCIFNASELNFYSDASRNFSLGFGVYCDKSWLQGSWKQVGITSEMEPSIQYLKLYALTAAVLAWLHRFQNKRIAIFCDNQAVVSMVNNNSSSCKNCMILIRFIVLQCLIHNVKLTAKYVCSKSNEILNSLSRLQTLRFKTLTQHLDMDHEPTQIAKEINYIPDIWLGNL